MEINIEHRLTAVEQKNENFEHRLDEVEKRQDNLDKLTTSVSLLAEREERMESDVKEIKCDVKALAEKPAKRWDGLVDKLLWSVAGAVLAFLLAKIGL